MDFDSISPTRFVAAQLAVVVAVIHLTLGAFNWIRWADAGFIIPRDLRWPLFVLSGLLIVVGLFLAAAGRYEKPVYAGGIVLMAVYILGYFGWHLTGHRPLLLFGEGHLHEGPFLPFVLDHLFAGPVKFVALVSEFGLLLLLVYLLIRE
ncbi:hypothetical protein SAMN05421858_1157 [Haladaptatus litoreus]|uniref:Uncharacterized protein n=1 Tax=Haladaptatus litoreus TaxID=553468 RepID=A0A1N6XJK7_9EURY|nr:hypothetical protein [Haladaptatus litoreus]SIR02447.1 hypothetical protein SAMN05421858_1157 [Haladaptatus litoreus]